MSRFFRGRYWIGDLYTIAAIALMGRIPLWMTHLAFLWVIFWFIVAVFYRPRPR